MPRSWTNPSRKAMWCRIRWRGMLGLLVACCVGGCARQPIRVPIKLSNPCAADYPDLLVPIYTRVGRVEEVHLDTELDRQICLQEWVKGYEQLE